MLKIQDLHFKFGRLEVLKGINLEIGKGKIFCLIGPNGAGKSTFLNVCCGLLKPLHGTVVMKIKKEKLLPYKCRQFLGYMPRDFPLYPMLTAVENLTLFARLYGVKNKKERIEDLLKKLQLKEKSKAKVKELSTGQKQRLALARAVLHRPQILFLDESTQGLDPISRKEFWDVIQERKMSGGLIILVTHYFEDLSFADEFGFLEDGKLSFIGNTSSLKAKNMAELFREVKERKAVQ